MIRLRSTVVVFVCMCGFSSAESTHWIGPPREAAKTAKQFVFEQEFSLDALPELSTLRVGADFCSAQVELNGRVIAEVTPYDLPMPVRIERWCRAGENRLTVRLQGDGGPTAFVLEVQDGSESFVVRSNPSWSRTDQLNTQLVSYGEVTRERWWQLKSRPSVGDFDEYNQWKQAKAKGTSAQLQVPDNFDMEVLYQVPKELGSWISMTLDDRGRLIVGREKSGVLRVTLPSGKEVEAKAQPKVEVLAKALKGCHGVLFSKGDVFVNASDSKALYRLRDTNGDDTYDEVRRLRDVPGGGGDHGRNGLVEGPDGAIYSIHGDAVDLPASFTSRIPLTREFAKSGRPTGGHLVRTDRDGSSWEVVASGLRNPFGIAFNRDGEPFTYDADSERHVGLPWYRPTRMNHLVSGTDYGWRSRGGELPWPVYLPEILPPNVLIGRGSPTAVKFGYESNFPPSYQRALFAADWSFGRVFAVHVIPRGASYSMHPETFLRGQPLNVCDVEFASDGSMYLLTGGYGTRSTLFRLRYQGPTVKELPAAQQERDRIEYSKKMRSLRDKLSQRKVPLDFCWEHLSHPDRWVRHAARLAIERMPPATWAGRLWAEENDDALLRALLALVRLSPDVDVERVVKRIHKVRLARLSQELQLTAVRIVALLDEYHSERPLNLSYFEELYPTTHRTVSRELCSLLCKYDSEVAVPKTLRLLAREPSPGDALHYLMALSKVKTGWTSAHREEYFRLLDGAKRFKGDEGLPELVAEVTRSAIANVPESDRTKFKQLLESGPEVAEEFPTREFVRKWRVTDFASTGRQDRQPDQRAGEPKHDAELGAQVFREAQCASCHRFGAVGRSFGPDLTGIAGRYRPEEILESILDPSKNISSRFVNHVVVTSDGQTHTGQVVWNGFRKSIIRMATDPMRMDKVIEIAKGDIESQQASKVSPMPQGLLDSFKRDEVESLLRYLREQP